MVDALVSSVRAAYPRLSHRYYALKARWFGKKTLPHWDRNAPLPKVENRPIGWSEAKDTVLNAYGEFSPRMAEVAERFFTRNWIDAPTRPGKQSGAFNGAVGIAVGQLTDCKEKDAVDYTALEVVVDTLAELHLPMLVDVPVGHEDSAHPVLLGADVVLDPRAGTLGPA